MPEGGFRWAVGDFNYDGTIDTNDYDLINRAWLLQGDPLCAGSALPEAASPPPETDLVIDLPPTFGTVPEPATLALVGLGMLGLMAGRRRRNGAATV